jgi:hypothetical protein
MARVFSLPAPECTPRRQESSWADREPGLRPARLSQLSDGTTIRKASSLDQDTQDALREVLASLEEDLQAAYIPGNRPENETHEDRLRALEAALKVALHALIDSK